jgi:hypothetical protein
VLKLAQALSEQASWARTALSGSLQLALSCWARAHLLQHGGGLGHAFRRHCEGGALQGVGEASGFRAVIGGQGLGKLVFEVSPVLSRNFFKIWFKAWRA